MSVELWQPQYTITPNIARSLMNIEAAKVIVDHTPITVIGEAELRNRARLRSTHFSTRIEGNRLTLDEAEQVINESKVKFHERERDVKEVQNYWNALLRVEEWAESRMPFSEDIIRRLHALVERGARAKPTMYREGQNVIRDSASGGIVYLPPEAKDVPKLMSELVSWVNEAERRELPIPIIAGLVHYQFVTTHPYYDGNGRTARLLVTFILQRGGYGMKSIFSLEEYHARDLENYYQSLAVHPHHNYYEGRAEVDLTSWLQYFISLLLTVFNIAKEEVLQYDKHDVPQQPEALRKLDFRARNVLALFARQEYITAADVAKELSISERMARILLQQWVKDSWLRIGNTSNKSRNYILTEIYRKFIGNLSAIYRQFIGNEYFELQYLLLSSFPSLSVTYNSTTDNSN
ncbi:MAG: Fic family protein [Paenibacillaceae bacterium]